MLRGDISPTPTQPYTHWIKLSFLATFFYGDVANRLFKSKLCEFDWVRWLYDFSVGESKRGTV